MSLSRAIGRDVAAAAAAAADVLVVADAAAADVLVDATDVLVVAADVLVVAADVLRLPLVYTRCCEVTQLSDTINHSMVMNYWHLSVHRPPPSQTGGGSGNLWHWPLLGWLLGLSAGLFAGLYQGLYTSEQ